ncbi:unnamed protein product [Mytilus coruscus]|uniref:Uncharacterized protein n=1 Tax=Mytilus coruscus TaxID=42192 RepID=A0A6J8DVS1_MYTCO|nr:unnamed protein product [Mytilus coruscus]
MVKENTFPLDNISFLLFLETVRFMSKRITSEMWYRETTKRFWKTGYRRFHGKFLYFMGGPKSIGHITENLSEPGMADPQDARINFAVPSQKILSDFIAIDLDIPKTTSPGILYPVLNMLHNQQNDEFMLCADGKMVTAGVDGKGDFSPCFGLLSHSRDFFLTMIVTEKEKNSFSSFKTKYFESFFTIYEIKSSCLIRLLNRQNEVPSFCNVLS